MGQLALSQIIPFEYAKNKAPKACSMDRGIWRWPLLSRCAPARYTMLPKTHYRQEQSNILIWRDNQWTTFKSGNYQVDMVRGRIYVAALKAYIDY